MALSLRKDQITSLRVSRRAWLEARAPERLRRSCPSEAGALDAPTLSRMVSLGIDAALGYGIADVADVGRFLELRCRYGEGFGRDAETAWAGEILASEDLTGSEKVDALEAYELFEILAPSFQADDDPLDAGRDEDALE